MADTLEDIIERSLKYSTIKSDLGEGVYYDQISGTLFWVDINNNKIHSSKSSRITTYSLDKQVSAIVGFREENLFVICSDGVFKFNLNTKNFIKLCAIPAQYLKENYRTNDGTMIHEGNFIFGIMDKNANKPGAVIISNKDEHKVVDTDICIPNSFIVSQENEILISDSIKNIIYKYNFSKEWTSLIKRSVWADFSSKQYVPDGGCIILDNRIFIAIWDGHKIIELDINGNIIDEIVLPVPRPTSCTYDKNKKHLFVSSAREGLSTKDLEAYPLSGSILEVQLCK